MSRKLILRIFFLLLLAALAYGVFYAWRAFPIISGYDAKKLCSCVFVEGRKEKEVKDTDLAGLPLSLGSVTLDMKDSSVTGTVLGMAKRRAIFREGFGCTLVKDAAVSLLRSQKRPAVVNDSSYANLPWPAGDQSADSLPPGVNRKLLDEAVSFAFAPYEKKKVHTRAVLIVYKNKIIAERYEPGIHPHTPLLGWSMAKSVTAALIGILVNEGRLQLNAPAPVPEWSGKGDPRKVITLEQLLQQTSGINFTEKYDRFSEVTDMLFNRDDMAGFTARLPRKDPPGSVFNYNGGNTNLLCRIIRQVTGEGAYHEFPYQALFRKIGMTRTLLEPDASGTFVGSSYVFATARDYARFGLLYLNDGVWMGERLLPAGWVEKTRTAPPGNPLRNYGYQFWLNGLDPAHPGQKEYPDVPADMFYADGFGGQRIFILPSQDLVVVRLGLEVIDGNAFLKKVLSALP